MKTMLVGLATGTVYDASGPPIVDEKGTHLEAVRWRSDVPDDAEPGWVFDGSTATYRPPSGTTASPAKAIALRFALEGIYAQVKKITALVKNQFPSFTDAAKWAELEAKVAQILAQAGGSPG